MLVKIHHLSGVGNWLERNVFTYIHDRKVAHRESYCDGEVIIKYSCPVLPPVTYNSILNATQAWCNAYSWSSEQTTSSLQVVQCHSE